MPHKYKNKYRIPSARLRNYDYGQNGSYFITICTQNQEHDFGEMRNDEMTLNEAGQLADKHWLEIPEHFPYVEFGNHIVMPNHIHGILIIDKLGHMVKNDNSNVNGYDCDENRNDSDENGNDSDENGNDSDVETRLIASLPPTTPPPSSSSPPTTTSPSAKPKITGGITGDYNPMLHENISRILRWYKGRCSFEIHKTDKKFNWQERFHDHIIRNAESFENIQNYIADNPKNWKEDKFHI